MEAVTISTAKSALNSVVKTATTAVTDEIGLLLGVQEELFFIKEEIEMMRAFLRVASAENVKGEVVSTWIKQVQELSFDVEDCLQEASVYLKRKSCLPATWSVKKRDYIARKIRMLKTRIEDVSKRNLRYNLINKDNGNHTYDQSAPTGSIANIEDLLVGLDKPKRQLVELILKEDGEVISVVGMGGLGKTTLVREVYGCPELRNKFTFFFWVTVLHPFNKEEFIESLAKQIKFEAPEVNNKGKRVEENRIKFELLPKKTVKEKMEEFIESRLAKQTGEGNRTKPEFLRKTREEKMEEVTGYLKDKNCLIVLDDLSSVSEWNEIKPILPTGNGSRIIVTTRYRKPLAEYISQPSDNIYHIKELSENDAFDLFCKAVYKTAKYCLVSNEGPTSTEVTEQNSNGQNQCMTNIITGEKDRESNDAPHGSKCNIKNGSSSTEITEEDSLVQKPCNTEDGSSSTEKTEENSEVQKQYIPITITEDMKTQAHLIIKSCGRLPLAVVTIGSYLATKPKTSDEWKTLHDHLSSELGNNPDLGVVAKTVLNSSYDGMPYHLKPCLLYLSVFHNHKEIRRSRIIRRWMADGYVMEGRKKMAADVGKGYFDDLMGRCLIQPSQSRHFSRCNIHDLLYELILAKAESENIASLLEDENHITTIDNVRHLVIAGGPCTRDEVLDRVKLSHLRSVSIIGEVGDYLRYPRMKMLRVLDLEGTLGLNNRDLKNVGKLRLLRYLGLRGTDISKLPDSLGKLSELETLDIKNTDIVRLPTGLTKLHKLSYLRAGSFFNGVMAPRGIGALRSLNNLGKIDIGRSKSLAIEMKNLTNLSKLYVRGLVENNAEALAKVIDRLKHLRSLFLKAEDEYEDIKCFALKRCVNYLSSYYQPRFLQRLGRRLDSLCFPDRRITHSPGLRHCLESVSSPPKYLQSLRLYSPIFQLPDWISSLENLQKIHLYDTLLKEIKAIEKLPNLKILNMSWCSIGEMEELCFGEGTFPMLQEMILRKLRGLKSVSIEKTALKKLEQLEISRCDGFSRQDGMSGLEFLEQLKEMEVEVEDDEDEINMFESNLQEQLNKLPQKPVLRVFQF